MGGTTLKAPPGSNENGISKLFGSAMAINYRDEYPVVLFPFLTDILVRFILTKPTEWKYEDEYRLLASEANMVKNGSDRGFFPKSQNGFVGVSPASLVGVVLGSRIAAHDAAHSVTRNPPRVDLSGRVL